jgi:hypothetical protein
MAVTLALPPCASFDPHGDASNVSQRWTRWLQSFETFAIASGVKDANQKGHLLLHCAGLEVQNIFTTLGAADNAYDTVKKALGDHFQPQSHTTYHRHVFRRTEQKPDETVSQFVTRLRQLSIGCEYGDNLEDFIKDQVVEACTNNTLRKKLLMETDLKLDKVLKLANALEASERQAPSFVHQAQPEVTNAVQSHRSHRNARPKQFKMHNTSSKPQSTTQAKGTSQTRGTAPCGKCGMNNHKTEDCRCSRNVRCFKCKRMGHFASVCRNKTLPRKEEKVRQVDSSCALEDHINLEAEKYDLLFATDSKCKTLDTHTVTMAGQSVQVLLDSGSTCNTLNEQVAEYLGVKTIPCSRTILPYQSTPIHITKKAFVSVCSGSKTETAEFLVLPGSAVPLIGFTLATQLNLLRIGPPSALNTDNVHALNTENVLQQYSGITNGIGKLKNFQVQLHIDPSVSPVAHQHSRVPFHLRDKVAQEVDKLLKADIIEPVYGPSEWVSRIVTPPKPNDPTQIRLCIDMRDANRAILRTRHPTPTIEELIHDINGSTVFSKIDLTAGYHQLELHPSSRYITTFSTHCGLFRYKRLNFGVNAAAELFQHTIQSLIADIPGSRNVSDDIIIFGKTQQDHDKALHAVLMRLHECGLTVNASKVALSKSSLEFFGFIFSAQGIAPSPAKISALQNAAAPTNPSEIRSFLGMAQYSARFIKDFATISEPLRVLTHKNAKWNFGPRKKEKVLTQSAIH